jgi:putative solute:sodium symporter small subunit
LKTSINEYNFNLFKPVSPYGRKNRDLIITLLIIWFVAVFGFQLLLLLVQKPTPEKTLLTFEAVWENVKTGKATVQEKMDFVNSLVAVAGKSSVKPANRIVLNNALTWSVFSMVSDSEKVVLSQLIAELRTIKEKLPEAKDAEYALMQSELIRIKSDINAIANEKTGIDPTNNKAAILPYNLNAENKEISAADIDALPVVMKLYLTHNQSFLTDSKVIGFPFHYFYTAEFLLILFVCMCMFYSIRVTQLQKKFLIKEE